MYAMSSPHSRRWCITQPYSRAPDIQIAALPPSAQVWARGHRHSRQREPLFYQHAAGEGDRHIGPTCPSTKWASSRTAHPTVSHQSPRRCNALSQGPAVPDRPPLAAWHLIPCVRLLTSRLKGQQDCARSAKSGLEGIRDDPGALSAQLVTTSPPALSAHRRRSSYYAARPARWPHRPLPWKDGPILPRAAAIEIASIES